MDFSSIEMGGRLRDVVPDRKAEVMSKMPSLIVNADVSELLDKQGYIVSNDAFFNAHARHYSYDVAARQVMERIDGVTAVDDEFVRTRRGAASVYDLSTGLKTFLNLHHLLQTQQEQSYYVSLDECGDNVKREILQLVAHTDAKMFMSGIDLPPFDYPMRINGEIIQGYKNYLKLCLAFC